MTLYNEDEKVCEKERLQEIKEDLGYSSSSSLGLLLSIIFGNGTEEKLGRIYHGYTRD